MTFSKILYKDATPVNMHFFLKLYSLESFAICAMSTSKYHEKINRLEIKGVSLRNPCQSYIYPSCYVIKDCLSGNIGRQANKCECENILSFYADNFRILTIVYVKDNGNFDNLKENNEDSQFIKTLLKNQLIKAGLL